MNFLGFLCQVEKGYHKIEGDLKRFEDQLKIQEEQNLLMDPEPPVKEGKRTGKGKSHHDSKLITSFGIFNGE